MSKADRAGSTGSTYWEQIGSRLGRSTDRNGVYGSQPHKDITLHPQLDILLAQPLQLSAFALTHRRVALVTAAPLAGAPVTQRALVDAATAEAVVGGVLGPVGQPDALIVGCRDTSGRLRVSGRTTPLSPSARATMTHVFQPPGASHPWPRTVPSSRFGQLPSQPVTYTRVKPRVVVELDVDGSFEDYRWRHACRFVRVRRDLKAADLPARTVE